MRLSFCLALLSIAALVPQAHTMPNRFGNTYTLAEVQAGQHNDKICFYVHELDRRDMAPLLHNTLFHFCNRCLRVVLNSYKACPRGFGCNKGKGAAAAAGGGARATAGQAAVVSSLYFLTCYTLFSPLWFTMPSHSLHTCSHFLLFFCAHYFFFMEGKFCRRI